MCLLHYFFCCFEKTFSETWIKTKLVQLQFTKNRITMKYTVKKYTVVQKRNH